ncbi:MAG: permease [Calditrichaeota bacterium]|nr:permease [Calditrichota bacterium]
MELLQGGLNALSEYLAAHVLTCLIPAFFIAGAIAVFVSKEAVIKYFGAGANKVLSYGVASVSGAILAVCSCTILPLFAGIRQRGAGLGPAVAFLYSGPAINVLAIVYSARLLGLDIGVARAVGAVAFSIIVGLMMAFMFRRSEQSLRLQQGDLVLSEERKSHPLWQVGIYFAAMVGLLVSASAMGLVIQTSLENPDGRFVLTLTGKWLAGMIALILLVLLVYLVARWYSRNEVADWMRETWGLTKKIFPILLVGVFVAGALKVLLPESVIQRWVGGNSLANNFLASVFGVFMYFSTLTEVPIVRALMDLGMGKGPVLALLLAGPSLSLPNMIVLCRVMGFLRTMAYAALVVLLSTIVGMVFGMISIGGM